MTSKIPDSNCGANPALILCAVSFTKLISVSAIKMTTRVSDSSSGWMLLNTLLRVLCKEERKKKHFQIHIPTNFSVDCSNTMETCEWPLDHLKAF